MRRRRAVAAPLPVLKDYNVGEVLAMLSRWAPPRESESNPRRRECRWLTWPEYIADARRLHPELVATFRSGRRASMQPTFASCVLAYADAHGVKALQRATHADICSVLPEARQ